MFKVTHNKIFYTACLVAAVFFLSSPYRAFALEPPTEEQISKYKADGTWRQRVKDAYPSGNHIISDELDQKVKLKRESLKIMLSMSCKKEHPDQTGIDDALSDFSEFHYSQKPGMGFCPQLDSVYQATILNQENGYLLEMSTITLKPDAPETCDTMAKPGINEDCFEITELPPRLLTETEVDAIKAAFDAVEMETIFYEVELCIDPCIVHTLQWDDVSLSAPLTGCQEGEVEVISEDSGENIVNVLDSFR